MSTHTKTLVEQLGDWAEKLKWEDLSEEAVEALKNRLLDSIGVAVGALSGEPVKAIRQMTEDLGGNPLVTLIGGGKTTPDYAAFYNGAAVRYLDFNDSYLAKDETNHPSDNIAPVIAAAEYKKASGKDFLLSLAIAYQIHTRLADVAPVRNHGFDHTTQGAYAAAAGAAKALGLDAKGIANAAAIAGTNQNALRVTRTGELSNWKGLAYPNTAMGAVHAALLSSYGITGPREVFEGNKGFMDSIAGSFDLNWAEEDLERVTQTIIKKYNAEIHSQSSIEGLLELKEEHQVPAEDIKEIRLFTFDVAYNIIGGGEEGDKKTIRLKEEADHSLPYMLAVAYLDGNVMPAQYDADRILKDDVQNLLQKVTVQPLDEYSDRFPKEMAVHLEVETTSGEVYRIDKQDYQGFTSNPATWETLMEKYRTLTKEIDQDLAEEIAATIKNIENLDITDLTDLLGKIRISDRVEVQH